MSAKVTVSLHARGSEKRLDERVGTWNFKRWKFTSVRCIEVWSYKALLVSF